MLPFPITENEAVELGRFSDRRGDFVRLRRGGDEQDESPKPRHGVPRELRIHKKHFTDIYSVKACLIEHPGVLEARGVVMLIRWWLRSAVRHSTRV